MDLSDIADIRIGARKISAVYIGENKLWPLAEGDPYWDKVVALLQFDGASLYDDKWGNNWTKDTPGTITYDIATPMVGDGSVIIDNTHAYRPRDATMVFGAQEFCIEMSVRPEASFDISNDSALFMQESDSGFPFILWWQNSSGELEVAIDTDFSATIGAAKIGMSIPLSKSAGVVSSWAVSRQKRSGQDDIVRGFVNGKLEASVTVDPAYAIPLSDGDWCLCDNALRMRNVGIDAFRVTIGAARRTEDYDVSLVPFATK